LALISACYACQKRLSLKLLFDKLNQAMEKGKGKPHLKPVKDHMANANNLAAALAIAPIAGIAAAVGKFYKLTK
jgi:hypothetical protein